MNAAVGAPAPSSGHKHAADEPATASLPAPLLAQGGAGRLFSPAIAVLNKLRYTTKFMVLALLFLAAMALVIYSLAVTQRNVIGSSKDELAGIELIAPLSTAIQLLQQHRGLSSGLLGGDVAMQQRRATKELETAASFDALDRRSAALSASFRWKRIKTTWQDLREHGLTWPAERGFLVHAELIDQLQALKIDIADRHSLSSDPDIDSHYLIATASVDLPGALEKLAQLRGLGTGILAAKRISAAQQLKLHELITELHVAHNALVGNFDKTARYNPGIRRELAAAARDMDASLRQIVALVEADIVTARFETSPAAFFNLTTLAIDAGYAQIDRVLLPMVRSLITARIERAQRGLYLNAGSAVALMSLGCYLFGGIYYATIGSIRTLARTARRFAAGDMRQRVTLQSKDELSQVGSSINEMADGFNALLAARLEDEGRLRAVVSSALDAMIQMDAKGNVSHWSAQAEKIFGWRGEEIVGRKMHAMIIPARYREAHVRGLAHFLATGQGPVLGSRIEIEALHRDGHEFPIELAISSIMQESGVEFCAFVRDISLRRKAEADLRVAAIAFETEEGMAIADADGIILNVNRSFTRITGYRAEEVIGHSPSLLQSGRHDAAFYRAMCQTLTSEKSWEGEIWERRKDGEEHPAWLVITAVSNEAGRVTNYVGAFSDITQRKRSEQTIHHLAFYDALTALPNRRLLLDRLQQALASSTRSGKLGALLLIDLDNFKTLNDSHGHDIGDLLLQQVAARLSTCTREGDTVARLGGDEFVVILDGLGETALQAASQAELVGNKILVALGQTYRLHNYEHHSTPSIGVTLFGSFPGTIDELMKRADLAMYQAKAAGRNTVRFFDPEMQAEVAARAELEEDLRCGLQSAQFLLYYQLQVDAAGRPIGAESLLRWQHPVRGLVSPGEFISLAEETGVILPLGHWVLETACRRLALWAGRRAMAHMTLAVNVSARQFHHRDFVAQVLAVLERTGANPQRLKLELTESLLVDDVEDVIVKMNSLKSRGVGFALDDFGTGYSSLSYLKRLPLDQLKIDQGFVKNILVDSNDAAIARMVIVLAGSLGLSVIAEGVETRAQRDFLLANGCRSYQGYLFGRPLPAAEFETLMNIAGLTSDQRLAGAATAAAVPPAPTLPAARSLPMLTRQC